MSEKKKECPFEDMTDKIETIDVKLLHTKQEIERIARMLKENPEECPDVVDSEKALQEALDVLFAEEIFGKNNTGEA
jgi:hypothetical protein